MKISDFKFFILEKQIFKLLTEAELKYLTDFREILKRIKSPIAKDLLNLEDTDLKISTNYLNIGDDEDEISFYGNNLKSDKYKIINDEIQLTHSSGLIRDRGIIDWYLPNLPIGTIGEIKHIYEPDDLHKFGYDSRQTERFGKIVHFVSDDGKNGFMPIKSLEISPQTKPQKSFAGRITRRILQVAGKKYTDKELEDFVNEFKAQVSLQKNRAQLFEEVDGEKIRQFYSGSNYDNKKPGPLHTSCMRYSECQNYLDIYVENPKVCKLLILKSPEDQGKIIGRALIWTLKSGETFMDRIYYSYESDVNLFKEYAQKKGWCYKRNQNSSELETIEFSPDKRIGEYLVVELEKSYFDYYPYMDTLKYLDERSNLLGNIGDGARLESTEGTRGDDCESCNGSGTVTCYECDGDGNMRCDECSGNGEIECSDCEGSGEITCSDCKGNKNQECDSCSGYGETDCQFCKGKGSIDGEDCQDCKSTGKVTCEDCDGEGQVECETCNGSGQEECDECSGRGEKKCDECSGRGDIECSNCSGDGEYDCPECT